LKSCMAHSSCTHGNVHEHSCNMLIPFASFHMLVLVQ
jgi:hypothetical protein